MKRQAAIISIFFLILYLGVLLHNVVPHLHIEEAGHVTNHSHDTHAHDHQHESSSEATHATMDLSCLLSHVNLGVNHFDDFNSTGFYSLAPPLVVVLLLLLGGFWPVLLLYRVGKPPDRQADKQLQLLCLSAASRRGPPSFS